MTEPTDAELDAVLCSQWPAFSMQATLVRMWVRAAMRHALAKWGTPAPVWVEPAQWQKRHRLRTNGEWENTHEHDAKWWRDNSQGWEIRALYTTPQPTQAQAGAGEPYGYVYTVQVAPIAGDERKVERTVFTRNKPPCDALALYTTLQPIQAQAGAVPLTDEQIGALSCRDGLTNVEVPVIQWLVREVEFMHGIKGGQHGAE